MPFFEADVPIVCFSPVVKTLVHKPLGEVPIYFKLLVKTIVHKPIV